MHREDDHNCRIVPIPPVFYSDLHRQCKSVADRILLYQNGGISRPCRWRKSSTTPIRDVETETFVVTHRYHPFHGRRFELVNYTICWGEARVFFYDDRSRLCSMPAEWTSVGAVDPFVAVSSGRSPFRVVDLLELSGLIQEIRCNAKDVHL